MSFAAFYRLFSFLLVAAGFLAVAGTGTLGLAFEIAFPVILILAWLIEKEKLPGILPRRYVPVLACAGIPAAYLEYRLLTGSLARTAVHFLLFLLALKWVTRKTDRDDAQLFLLSFCLLLSAALLTDGMIFLPFLALFTVTAAATLIAFEMKRSSRQACRNGMLQPFVIARNLRGSEFELFGGFSARRFVAVAAGLAGFVILVAIPLFFLLPRTSLGARFTPESTPRLISGFSEKVTLGEIGRILESGDLVMKVKMEGPHGSDVRWRGIALDYFDGKTWVCSSSARDRIPIQGGYFKLQETARSGTLLVQTIFLEPIATDVVFGAHQMLAVSTNLGVLGHDRLGNVFSEAPRRTASRYAVVSDATPLDPDQIPRQSGNPPEGMSAEYLQLPGLDPRIARLAQSIAGRPGTPLERAHAVEQYLRTHYNYSLQLRGTPTSPDPLAMFLFDVRSGHCEYFATAMAVMLRQLGIPARMVNGFRTGDYNSISNHWTVRQYHAHSWVEAWIPPYGWAEFDPTPPDPRFSGASHWIGLSRLLDAADLWWADYVIHYEVRKQSRLLRTGIAVLQKDLNAAGDTVVSLGRNIRISASGPSSGIWMAALAILVVAAVGVSLAAGQIKKLRKRLRILHDPAAAVISFYAEALTLLQTRGHVRARGETPLEYAGRMARQPFGEALAALTAIYYRIRFARNVEPEDMERVRQLLHNLRTSGA